MIEIFLNNFKLATIQSYVGTTPLVLRFLSHTQYYVRSCSSVRFVLSIDPTKDTNRKIRKTRKTELIIHLCFQIWFHQQCRKHWGSLRGYEAQIKGSLHALQRIFNQSSNTVIYEKCWSHLSVSIFRSPFFPQLNHFHLFL